MSSSDPEELGDDPFADRWHRIVIPEATDVAKIFGDDIDPSREPLLTAVNSFLAAAQWTQASGVCLDQT